MISNDGLLDILEGCRKGNRLSQKALYKRFFRYGMNVCNRYARSEAEAEEMLNDAFLRIFTKIDLYNAAYAFPTWFHTVVIRTCINYLKKYQDLTHSTELEFAEQKVSVDENAIERLSFDEIIVMVRQLPTSYRAVFNLAVIEGYSHVEIAEMTGITEGTSRSNLMVARQKLKIMVSQSHKVRI